MKHTAVTNALFRRILFPFLLISIVFISGLTVLEFIDTKNRLLEETRILQRNASENLAEALWQMNLENLQQLTNQLATDNAIAGIHIRDHNGEEILSSTGYWGETSGWLAPYYSLSVPIVYQHETGSETVGIGEWYVSRQHIISLIQVKVSLIVSTTLLMMLALWFTLASISRRHLAQPLRQLTSAVEKIEFEELEQISPAAPNSDIEELNSLESSFRSMTLRLHM